MHAAFEVRCADVLAAQKLTSRSRDRDPAVDHDMSAMCQPQRMEVILLDQEYGQALSGVELADRCKNLPDDQRRETQRRLVEKQKPRPRHQGAGDGKHLLLAARQRAAALSLPLLKDGK